MEIRRLTVQLPIWPDRVRGGPNALLRTALFAGVPSRFRKILEHRASAAVEPEGVVVASQDGITMLYTGTQLNQYDADVFFEVLQRVRRSPLGEAATFAGADFLRSIGRTASKRDYEDLDMSLRRLTRGLVDVKWRSQQRPLAYTGSLIADFVRETDSKLYRINLSPSIKSLFEPSSFTMLEWNERLKLLRNPLAQWLHSYYSTHAKPFAVTVAFLQKTAGQETARTRDFAKALRVAFGILEAELGWSVEWLSTSLVQVSRNPSDTQARHLEVRSARKKLKNDAAAASKRPAASTSRFPTRKVSPSSELLDLEPADTTLAKLFREIR
jgi:hypothetical protein